MHMKLCMVGCGNFASIAHGPAQKGYASINPEVTLCACCDADSGRARQYARDFGYSRSYTDLSEMLRVERPNAAVVAVPPTLACEVASFVIEQGIPILLEKPPGLSGAELNRLRAVARRTGVPAQVAFNRRYMPVMQKAAEVLAKDWGEDPVTRVSYEMVRFNRWDQDFSTTAIHALDSALFLAGSPLRNANIRFSPRRQDLREGWDVELEGNCLSGTRVLVAILPVSGHNEESAQVHGIGRCVALKLPFPGQGISHGRLEHWCQGEIVETYTDENLDFCQRVGVYGETEAFLDALRLGHSPKPLLDDCVQQVELMEAIRIRRTSPIPFEAREETAVDRANPQLAGKPHIAG